MFGHLNPQSNKDFTRLFSFLAKKLRIVRGALKEIKSCKGIELLVLRNFNTQQNPKKNNMLTE